jgi:geranylgeranyl pyrophosphate synthase
MGLYQDAIQLLLIRKECDEWPELHSAVQRAFVHRPVAWHFPVRACEAVGSPGEFSLPAVAAITCAHMAIMLVDDILDEDPRGAYRQLGVGKVANLAVALNGLGLAVLMATHLSDSVNALNQMIQNTAHGQDLDAMNLQSPDDYWSVTRLKSSPYFGTALYLGAVFGGAKGEVAEQLRRFGELYGEIMQIHDDLNDSLAVPANVDWLAGRSPLPLLFAQVVDHPYRQRFIDLRKQADDLEVLNEAQTILVQCGAISYSVNELVLRHARAHALLNEMKLSKPESLAGLLDEAIAPVKHLFAKVGADFDATV